MRFTPMLALVLLLAPALGAQQVRPGLLVGRITETSGAPVAEAIVRATQGARTLIAEADEDGDFRVAGLAGGIWTISVRRLGFRPVAVNLEMPAQGLRRNFTVERVTLALDPILVAAKWTGVRGIVGDARRISPLAGARVWMLGSETSSGSDTLGNFSLPVRGGRDLLLRVERAGYSTRIISVSVPKEGYIELEVPLDTVAEPARDTYIWRDLDQRLKYATPRAVLVSRQEIAETDAVSLGAALAAVRSVNDRGVIINRRACVFVNGVARPGFPVDAILAGDVEFVEAYPPGTDLTRTLALKWPPGAACGVAEGTVVGVDRRQVAQFVSVWLRAP